MFHLKNTLASKSDEALIALLSSNRSNEALTELHKRYAHRVLGYFLRMFNGDKEKAQDFVQDLFLRILSKHKQFDAERKFFTWMFTIASNMAKTELKRKSRFSDTGDFEAVTWSPDEYTKERFHYQLSKAIDNLDELHRSVFVLRYLNQLSLKEISEVKEIPIGTVKSRLFKATKEVGHELYEFRSKETNVFKLY